MVVSVDGGRGGAVVGAEKRTLSGKQETLQRTKLQVTLSCEINNTELIAAKASGESGEGIEVKGVKEWWGGIEGHKGRTRQLLLHCTPSWPH